MCLPGSLSLSGPSTVTGTAGGSLSLRCQYKEVYKTYNKYWCLQPCLPLFFETVEPSASMGEVRRGRVSITGHPGNLTFTVTLENVTANDAGKYRCGISTPLQEDGLSGFLPEPFFQVQVLVSPGKTLLPLVPERKESELISAEQPWKFQLRRLRTKCVVGGPCVIRSMLPSGLHRVACVCMGWGSTPKGPPSHFSLA